MERVSEVLIVPGSISCLPRFIRTLSTPVLLGRIGEENNKCTVRRNSLFTLWPGTRLTMNLNDVWRQKIPIFGSPHFSRITFRNRQEREAEASK